jgi:hypothetical protein
MNLTPQQRAHLIQALSESACAVLRTSGIVGGIRIHRAGATKSETLLSLDIDAICFEIARNGSQHVVSMLDEADEAFADRVFAAIKDQPR